MPLRIAWGLRTSFLVGIAMTLGGQNAMAQTWSAPAPLNDYAYDASGNDDSVELTTDGAGNWVAVWSSRDSLSATIGTDRDIHFARSTDGGVTWTDPVALNSDAATDEGDDWYPQIVTDGAGKWVAVWSTWNDSNGNIGADSDVRVSESTDNGATWSAAVALNSNAGTDTGDDYRPQVIADPTGTGLWIAVWYSNDDLGGTIGTDDDIFFTYSLDGAFPWGTAFPQALNTNSDTDTGDDRTPEIAVSGSDWVAVWRSDENLGGTVGTDKDIFVARSLFGSPLSWESPRALNTNASTDVGDDFVPQVTVDSGGNWMATWYSYDDLGGTIGSDLDIFLARSTDAGDTWTTPLALNTNAATDSGDDFHPQTTTDDAGLCLAIWCTRDELGGTIGDDRDIVVARSTDAGVTWTAPAPVNHFAGSDNSGEHDYRPQVTTDGAGTWVTVWRSNYDQGTLIDLGPDDDIMVSRSADDGVSWTNAAALNNTATENSGADYYQQIATDGAGNWVAAWSSYDDLGGMVGIDGDIIITTSDDDGLTWTSAQPLNANATDDTGLDWLPVVATDAAGRWVAAWSSFDDLGGTVGTDTDVLWATSLDNGATWTAPLALNSNAVSDSGQDTFPNLATDGAGNWVAVWFSSDDLGGTIGTDGDVLVCLSNDNASTWSSPEPLNSNAVSDSGQDTFPNLATDGAGHWVVVWYSNDDLGGMIGSDNDILVATSTNNGLSWTDPQPLNANAGSDTGADLGPQLATDGAGTWIVVWQSDDVLGGTIGTDSDILFAVSQNNGATWTSPQPVNVADSDIGGDWEPHISVDNIGNWFVTWASTEDVTGTIGTDRDILASISSDGGATWSSPQPVNINADSDSGSDSNPQIAASGIGVWVSVWDSYDSLGGTIGANDTDILVTRTVYPPGDIIIDPNTTGATDVVQDPDGAAILLANPLTSPLDLRPDDLAVGNTASGEISIENNGRLHNAWGRIAYQTGSAGVVTVSGAGSQWSCNGHLYVGKGGAATVILTDGGSLSTGAAFVGTDEGATGDVTVEGAGATWSSIGDLTVGHLGTASLTVQNGGSIASDGWTHIARTPNASGSIVVKGAGSTWNDLGPLYVGLQGEGSLTVQDGALVASEGGSIGEQSGSSGTVTVEHSGSLWNVTGALTVGNVGDGALNVLDGGVVTSGGSIAVGDNPGAMGTVTVDGTGSLWTTANWLDVGDNATGALTIQNGGAVSNNNARVGHWSSGIGAVAVDGVSSTWTCNSNLWIGDQGDGALALSDGGLVAVGGSASIDASGTSQATLALAIGAVGTGLLDVAGSVIIGENSTLRVTLDPGVVPPLGQQYVVVTADGGVTGTFSDEQLQVVAGDTTLTWTVHYNPTDITLEVVNTGVYGDCDNDGDVDLADFACFQTCFTGAGGGSPDLGCEYYDADNDDDVDLADFEVLAGAITGPTE